MGKCPDQSCTKGKHFRWKDGKKQVCAIYQNTDRSCRGGDNCSFQHIGLGQKVAQILINTLFQKGKERAASSSKTPSYSDRKRMESVLPSKKASASGTRIVSSFIPGVPDKPAGVPLAWERPANVAGEAFPSDIAPTRVA